MMIKAGSPASPLIPASTPASSQDSGEEQFSTLLNDKLLGKKPQTPVHKDNRLNGHSTVKKDKQEEIAVNDLLGNVALPGKDILNLQGEVLTPTVADQPLPLETVARTDSAPLSPDSGADALMPQALTATAETTEPVKTSDPAIKVASLSAKMPVAADVAAKMQETLAGEAGLPQADTKTISFRDASGARANIPSLFLPHTTPLGAATSISGMKYSPLSPQPAMVVESSQSDAASLTSELQADSVEAPLLKHDAPVPREMPLPGAPAGVDAAAKSPPPTSVVMSPAVLNQPPGTPAWQHALSQQLSYFTRNGVHNAELRLHPEELGAVQVNLQLNNEKAQLHFITSNHQVRAALEAAMPHLRTSLEESGISLGQSSVGEEASSSGHPSGQKNNSGRINRLMENEDNIISDNETKPVIHRVQLHNGINTFV